MIDSATLCNKLMLFDNDNNNNRLNHIVSIIMFLLLLLLFHYLEYTFGDSSNPTNA